MAIALMLIMVLLTLIFNLDFLVVKFKIFPMAKLGLTFHTYSNT